MSRTTRSITAQLAASEAQVAELEKKLKAAEDSRKYWSDLHGVVVSELESLHAVIDLLPGAPPRKTPHSNGYGDVEHKLAARLAAYFATKAH